MEHSNLNCDFLHLINITKQGEGSDEKVFMYIVKVWYFNVCNHNFEVCNKDIKLFLIC